MTKKTNSDLVVKIPKKSQKLVDQLIKELCYKKVQKDEDGVLGYLVNISEDCGHERFYVVPNYIDLSVTDTIYQQTVADWSIDYKTENCGFDLVSYFSLYKRNKDDGHFYDSDEDDTIYTLLELFDDFIKYQGGDASVYVYTTSEEQPALEKHLPNCGWKNMFEFYNENSGNACTFWMYKIEQDYRRHGDIIAALNAVR
jgi:hypothetical protein